MTFREFTGKNVEGAIRAAMAEYGADLSELDIEILSQGSKGVLGVGAEDARILAAPKSAAGGQEAAPPAPTRSAPAAPPPAVAAEPTPSADAPETYDAPAASVFDAIEQTYSVDRYVVAAIWGIE